MSNQEISQAAKDLQNALDNPQDAKVRVTISLDGDLLEAIRDCAKEEGSKYQPWLNQFLRDQILGDARKVDMEKVAHDVFKKDFKAVIENVLKSSSPSFDDLEGLIDSIDNLDEELKQQA